MSSKCPTVENGERWIRTESLCHEKEDSLASRDASGLPSEHRSHCAWIVCLERQRLKMKSDGGLAYLAVFVSASTSAAEPADWDDRRTYESARVMTILWHPKSEAYRLVWASNIWRRWWLGAWWSCWGFLHSHAARECQQRHHNSGCGQRRRCSRGAKRLPLELCSLRVFRPQLDTVSARSQSTLWRASAARNRAVLWESANSATLPELELTKCRVDPQTPASPVLLLLF